MSGNIYLAGKIPISMIRGTFQQTGPTRLKLDFSEIPFFKLHDAIYSFGNLIFLSCYQDKSSLYSMFYPNRRDRGCLQYSIHNKLPLYIESTYKELFDRCRFNKFTGNRHNFYLYNDNSNNLYSYDLYQSELQNEESRYIKSVIPESYLIKKVECGLEHTLILTTCGKLFGKGCNTDGQLANKHLSIIDDSWEEIKIPNKSYSIVDVVCGDDFSFALTNTNEWFAWGNNEQNQLLVDSTEDKVAIPTKSYLSYLNPTEVKLGACFGIALNNNNDIIVWGKDGPGMLEKQSSERYVIKSINYPISSIYAAGLVAALKTDCGIIKIWGNNNGNAFGLSHTEPFIDKPTYLETDMPVKFFKLFRNFCIYSN